LLEFCADVGIREFHHISTAYVCGDRQGRVLEDEFDQGQQFRNVYERTKFTAEQLLREATCLESLTVYRPSIIVGDSETGYSTTFHNMYLPLQLAYLATSSGFLRDASTYMKVLGLQGGERKNLVAVNWVAEVLVHILQQPQLHGRTYHLANPQPVTTAELDRAFAESISKAVGKCRESSSPSTPSLEGFREQMRVYKAYLGDDPEFDVRQTQAAAPGIPCPRLDHETLVRLARYAIDVGFGWPRPRPRQVILDVGEYLGRLPCEEHRADSLMQRADDGDPLASWLRFEVSGSYGGTWDVYFQRSEIVQVERDCNGPAGVSAYLNVHTLCDILSGTQTVAGALTAGQLVVEGSSDKISRGPVLLEALVHTLQDIMRGRLPGRESLNEHSRNIHPS
jgi:hypothetical protein